MRIGTWLLLAGLSIAGPLGAQSEKPVIVFATRPAQFASWPPAAMLNEAPGFEHPRARNVLIGSAIGAAAGLVVCTIVSNLVNDPGSGFSTCTLNGYLLTGGIGLAGGLLIGLIV